MRGMKRWFGAFSGVALALMLTVAVQAADIPSPDDAVAAGKAWLAVIDGKNYRQSWKDASDLFQQGVSEKRWDEMVGNIRKQLGPLKGRVYDSVKLTKTLPGAPDGDYAVITFRSSFEKRADADEVVTLMLDNGHWKAGGYYIH
jgi:hypothetical protein